MHILIVIFFSWRPNSTEAGLKNCNPDPTYPGLTDFKRSLQTINIFYLILSCGDIMQECMLGY